MSSSSFRNNRVIIASLFLPNTVVVGHDPLTKSPEHNFGSFGLRRDGPAKTEPSVDVLTSELGKRLGKPEGLNLGSAAPKRASLTLPPQTSAPLRSIIEDLKDRSRNPSLPPPTPGDVPVNPFSNLASITTPGGSPSKAKFTDLPSRRDSLSNTAKSPVSPPRRRRSSLRRKSSRSLSRTPGVTASPGEEREPENFYIEPNTHCNGGLKNAIESVSTAGDRRNSFSGRPADLPKLRKKLWVGTLGAPSQNGFSPNLRQSISARMRGDHESEVVWCNDAVFESAYDGFCHQVLWPALHYAVPDAPRTKLFYESASFKDYVALNQHFADVIKSIWREGDIIWVHDYHLMLLPAMLRASGISSSAPIGFFLHVAFPSSEIFRCFSVRESLLRGVLGADLIGFQTASYARHFRQTVSRILSVEALPRGVQLSAEFDYDDSGKPMSLFGQGSKQYIATGSTEPEIASGARGRFVDVGVFPMGIDVAQLKEKKRDPEVGEWIALLQQRYAGMKILVGRDKLDEIQGVRQKIQSFELFLDKHPEYQGKVVLIQIALPSAAPESSVTSPNNQYSVSSSILTPISHINSRFSTLTYQPVVFLHTQDVSFSQYLALMSVADAFIVTSLREGMALRTHEYVIAQETRKKPLILSEFTGSYSYTGFRSCIAINPWDTRGTADAILQALSMPEEEAHSRWEDLHNHVVAQTAQAFVTSFLTRVLRANAEHVNNNAGAEWSVPNLNIEIGRVMGRWKHSSRRLVLLDWEGTLVHTGAHGLRSDEENDAEVAEAIAVLKNFTSDNKKNEVWLLSGLPAEGILTKLAAEVPKIGIIAENGCFVRPRPTRGDASPPWVSLVANVNMTWKAACLEMLSYYTERTPGSFVEAREASVVWRFWTGTNVDSSDRQWARRQAAEAQNHIFDSIGERYGLRIIPGSNSFLVIPNNVSRSNAVGAVLDYDNPSSATSPVSNHSRAPWVSPDPDMSRGGSELDFLLAISADEKLLRRLNDLDNSETCSTSDKGTDAKWKLEPKEVLNVLRRFGDAAA